MSKTNDTSKPATLEDHRPLADSEVDAVTGGWLPTGIAGAQMYTPEPAAGNVVVVKVTVFSFP